MGERLVLVIGAENDRFGKLGFIPAVSRDLFAAVIDPRLGGCRPALPHLRMPLVGPDATSPKVKKALEECINTAAGRGATLSIYFIGHGVKTDNDYYLIGTETKGAPNSDTAVLIGQRMAELLRDSRKYGRIGGVMLVLDACHGGTTITEPVPGVLREGTEGHLEIWAAASKTDVAFSACFTRSITNLLTRGDPESGARQLTVYDVSKRKRLPLYAPSGCENMASAPFIVASSGQADPGLYLGWNRAADIQRCIADTPAAYDIDRLTRYLVKNVARHDELMLSIYSPSPLIAIVGAGGVGKSTLLATLARVSVVGEGMLDAYTTVRAGNTINDVAKALKAQLTHSASYRAACARWRASVPRIEQDKMPSIDRVVSGPLSFLPAGSRLRVGLDSVDSLATVDRRRMLERFTTAQGAQLIVTARDLETEECRGARVINVPDRDWEGVNELVLTNVQDDVLSGKISELADGDWLLARVLIGLTRADQLDIALTNATTLREVFARAVASASKSMGKRARIVSGVVEVLAVSPVGPVVPFAVLERLIIPKDRTAWMPVDVRDAVVELGEMVTRADPNSTHERVGAAHDLIKDYLQSRLTAKRLRNIHSRLATLLRFVTSESDGTALTDEARRELRAYADRFLPEHLLAGGDVRGAIAAVSESGTPADVLARWRYWEREISSAAADHEYGLTVRAKIAEWSAKAGDVEGALDQLTELLHDQREHFGAQDRATLHTELRVAHLTGQGGDIHAALDQLRALLAAQESALGRDDPDTLETRATIAHWTGRAGKERSALKQLHELLPDQRRALGELDPQVLTTRATIAHWTGMAGEPAEARHMLEELLPDRRKALGSDHQLTLLTRADIAKWRRKEGEPAAAARELRNLLEDQRIVLGKYHPETLATRAYIALCLEDLGEAADALGKLRQVLADREHVLGPNYPLTLDTRRIIARLIGRLDGPAAALSLLRQLLPKELDALGRSHPYTLATRADIAYWAGRSGDEPGAAP